VALITFVVLAGAGGAYVWTQVKPVYTTRGAIEVAPILTNILTGQAERGEISNYQAFMNTQARIMTSDRVLQRVADELQDKKLSFFTEAPDLVLALRAAVQSERISIAPVRRTQWIELKMQSRRPAEAEMVINAFIRAYMAVTQSSALEGSNRQLQLLVEERKALAAKLEDHRRRIQELAAQYGTDSLQGHQNISLDRVMALQTELTNLEIRHMNLQAQLQTSGGGDQQPQAISPLELVNMQNTFVNNDLLLRQITTAIAEAEQEYADLEQRLAPGNPQLMQKQKTLEELRTRLTQRQEELRRTFDELVAREQERTRQVKAADLRAELELTEALEKEYRRKLAEENANYRRMGIVQQQIADIQAQMAQERERYDHLGKRIYDLEMELKQPARISVADYANTGLPENKRAKLLFVVLCGSLACGVFLAFVLGRADHSMRTPEDIIRCIGVPVIGTTGHVPERRRALPDGLADDYDAIRANLRLLSDGEIPPKLVVTSAAAQEGKTTFAINLATSLARCGSRVLLVDGDFRKPDIGETLKLDKHSWGVEEVLLGLVPLEEAVHRLGENRPDVLVCKGRDLPAVLEVLSRPEGAERVNGFSTGYEYVVIDTPPILAAPDALLWAKVADAVVLSSLAGHTEGPELKEALARLAQIRVRVLGNVLSNVKLRHSYHRYGYRYGYGYGSDGRRKRRKREDRPLLLSPADGAEVTDRSSTG